MTEITRRTALKGAAWAAPIVALTVATPLAAASNNPPALYCTSGDPDVKDVQVRDGVLYVSTTETARNSIDVTVRQQGYPEIHYNLVPEGTPTNNVPHMRNYKRGEVVAIPLFRDYDLGTDWMQVKTIHAENCVEVR